MDEAAFRLRICGQVQGVGYRAFVVAEARRLHLNGWVRNRADGTVEAVVSGDNARVEAFVAACRRGPLAAKVERLDREPIGRPAKTGFRQLPTV